jgi:NAD(P)-dependent dehydrogenase (short-subunit alcohol dehydrogenase family)
MRRYLIGVAAHCCIEGALSAPSLSLPPATRRSEAPLSQFMFSLTNKKAVITGGGSGIGRAISLLFARQGAEVHIIELSAEAGQQTADEIRAAGGTAQVHAADVSQQAAVVAAFEAIGRVDVLVNNAGIAHVGNVETTPEADFERVSKAPTTAYSRPCP